eukprot:scaffold759_cov119-Isochrysis_galbana.AAC.16
MKLCGLPTPGLWRERIWNGRGSCLTPPPSPTPSYTANAIAARGAPGRAAPSAPTRPPAAPRSSGRSCSAALAAQPHPDTARRPRVSGGVCRDPAPPRSRETCARPRTWRSPRHLPPGAGARLESLDRVAQAVCGSGAAAPGGQRLIVPTVGRRRLLHTEDEATHQREEERADVEARRGEDSELWINHLHGQTVRRDHHRALHNTQGGGRQPGLLFSGPMGGQHPNPLNWCGGSRVAAAGIFSRGKEAGLRGAQETRCAVDVAHRVAVAVT